MEPFCPQPLQEGSARYIDALKAAGLQWAAARLTVSLCTDDATFTRGLEELPAVAKALQGAGVTRVGTAISSSSEDLIVSGLKASFPAASFRTSPLRGTSAGGCFLAGLGGRWHGKF